MTPEERDDLLMEQDLLRALCKMRHPSRLPARAHLYLVPPLPQEPPAAQTSPSDGAAR